jgi:flavin-dependent dehydrogenase
VSPIVAPRRVDVLVVGGGPAGAAAALGLARARRSVVLVHRPSTRERRVGETLPPVASAILGELGVWDRFLAQRHLPSGGIRSAWGRADLYEQSSAFNPYGSGWHLDRSAFDRMLLEAAEQAGVDVRHNAVLLEIVRSDGGGWLAELRQGDGHEWLTPQLVIDATGRVSWLPRRQGTPRRAWDRLVGVVQFLVEDQRPELSEPFVLVEATRRGWWYSAPVPERQLVVAYMTDSDLLPRDHSLRGEYWQAELARAPHTLRRTGASRRGAAPWVVAAASSKLDCAVGSDWLAVGDAAAAFDPLSSQGLCHALETGLLGGRAADRYLTGDRGALAAYDQQIDEWFRRYLELRTDYYGRERRWLDAPFWRRRAANLAGC